MSCQPISGISYEAQVQPSEDEIPNTVLKRNMKSQNPEPEARSRVLVCTPGLDLGLRTEGRQDHAPEGGARSRSETPWAGLLQAQGPVNS